MTGGSALALCPDGRNIKLEWILTDERGEKERVMEKVGANLHISYRGFYQLLRSNPSGLILVSKYDQYTELTDQGFQFTFNIKCREHDAWHWGQGSKFIFTLREPEEHILNIFHSNFAVWQRFAALIISCKLFENLSPAPSINNFVPILELLIAGWFIKDLDQENQF